MTSAKVIFLQSRHCGTLFSMNQSGYVWSCLAICVFSLSSEWTLFPVFLLIPHPECPTEFAFTSNFDVVCGLLTAVDWSCTGSHNSFLLDYCVYSLIWGATHVLLGRPIKYSGRGRASHGLSICIWTVHHVFYIMLAFDLKAVFCQYSDNLSKNTSTHL